jgi:hypothetical protein
MQFGRQVRANISMLIYRPLFQGRREDPKDGGSTFLSKRKYQTAWRHISEHSNIHIIHSENLTSRVGKIA